jgi:hypothetical protein
MSLYAVLLCWILLGAGCDREPRGDFAGDYTREPGEETVPHDPNDTRLGSPAWERSPISEAAGARMEGMPITDLSTDPQREDVTVGAGEPTLADQVRSALQQDPALAQAARDVTVTSQNGRVLLRGSVQTMNEKQQIESRAAEVVLPENVENQIQVTPQ